MLSFTKFITESTPPMQGVHPEVWKAHERHVAANKKHYESGAGIHKAAATKTFRTLQKKLDKHHPDESREKSKHLKIMQDMMHHSDKHGDL